MPLTQWPVAKFSKVLNCSVEIKFHCWIPWYAENKIFSQVCEIMHTRKTKHNVWTWLMKSLHLETSLGIRRRMRMAAWSPAGKSLWKKCKISVVREFLCTICSWMRRVRWRPWTRLSCTSSISTTCTCPSTSRTARSSCPRTLVRCSPSRTAWPSTAALSSCRSWYVSRQWGSSEG